MASDLRNANETIAAQRSTILAQEAEIDRLVKERDEARTETNKGGAP